MSKSTFEEVLAEKGTLIYTNVGDSMYPLIKPRDLLVIKRPELPLKRLDIPLYKRDSGQYVLHRILKIMPDGRYWIVGDNCVSGELVDRENILGLLTGVSRNGKLIKNTDFRYRAYVRLWCAPYPVRFFILRALRLARRVRRRFLKRRS